MNWNISAWCIRNPIPPIILFVLLTVFGLTSLAQLGIEEEPNIDMPWVSVGVTQSGAAPVELETQVTRKVEDAIASVANVKHIYSDVNTGYSNTNIEFELGTNSDRATNDVREAMSRIRQQLPRGIEEPIVQRQDYVSGSSITYTISSSKNRPTIELSWLVDNDVSRALMANTNIGQVYRFGGVDRQISVNLDPIRLEAHGVTADMVNTQLRALNINLPGGRGTVGAAEESIRTLGSAPSVAALGSTRIMLPGKRWVELRALGDVYEGISEQRHKAMLDGKSVVSFEIIRRRGKNIVAVEKESERILDDLQKRLGPDIKFTRIFSDAKYVRESCDSTFESLFLGAILAVIVIWAFLRDGRAALIAAVAMPLSVIPTFGFMKLADFTLNDMSLLGMALVIGILVDDAIVEIENIVRHMNQGKKPFFAAIDAADEIGLAVVATTMAAVVVFLPVAFMGGIPGQFFRQFGLTVSVAVFCSLLVARLITPVMAAYWLKPHKEVHETGMLNQIYDHALNVALKHRLITAVAGIIFFAASIALFKALPTSLVSRIDRGESTITVELPPGSQLPDTLQVVERLTDIVKKHDEVVTVFSTIGKGGEVNQGRIQIILKPKGERKLSQDEFEDALRPQLSAVPGARVTFNGGWGSGNVQILLTSYDTAALEQTAQELTKQVRTIPELTDVQSTASALRPEIVVRPDFARAAEQGVSVESIARTALVATVGDTEANRPKFDLADRQIPIVVQIDPKFRHKMSVIGNLRVAGNDGRLVPLSSVAKVSLDSGLFKIDRHDRARQVSINAKFGANYTLGQALETIHNLPAYKNMPSSLKEHKTGDAEIQGDIFGGFGYAIVTGVLLIYAVLVLLFRGFLQPFTIMMSLPLSLGGALIGLVLFNKPIDMYALIGIVMLMGLVTKNAILLVEYCLSAMSSGMNRRDAIFSAGRTRMRPILMTTTAMIAGMLPIAVGLGAGSEARAPMAIAVVGGLFMSTLLTLVVVPVVFTYMDDLQNWIFKVFKSRQHGDESTNIFVTESTDESARLTPPKLTNKSK
ncbi:MAG: efflux RND transporter permease subunit [Cyanobacteria bacterium SZAS-4]|nr:efflux RND transporter permease subunit [Cyanobacteria bacterium SZAS-4]